MRAALVLTLLALVGFGCRAKHDGERASTPAGQASTLERDGAAAALAVHRWTAPLSAARSGDGFLIAANDRSSGQLTAAFLPAGSRTLDETAIRLQFGTFQGSELGVLPAPLSVGVLITATADGGAMRQVFRLDRSIDAGLHSAPPVEAGEAICTTFEGVTTLARVESGWKPRFWPFRPDAPVVEGPEVRGRAEGVLVCGRRRVFVVATGDEVTRAIAWDPAPGKSWSPVVLPKPDSASNDNDMVTTTDGNSLLIARMGENADLAMWSWGGEAPAGDATKVALGVNGDTALEAVEATEDAAGLVLTRSIEGAKGCSGGADASDIVAQVGIVGRRDGRLLHAPERIETWRCGAEAGPFWASWVGGTFAGIWPRGADAACARAGVRYGGFGYALVDPAGGRARIGRAGGPAETVANVGCDEQRCYVASITRGSTPCGGADAPDAGTLEITTIP